MPDILYQDCDLIETKEYSKCADCYRYGTCSAAYKKKNPYITMTADAITFTNGDRKIEVNPDDITIHTPDGDISLMQMFFKNFVKED